METSISISDGFVQYINNRCINHKEKLKNLYTNSHAENMQLMEEIDIDIFDIGLQLNDLSNYKLNLRSSCANRNSLKGLCIYNTLRKYIELYNAKVDELELLQDQIIQVYNNQIELTIHVDISETAASENNKCDRIINVNNNSIMSLQQTKTNVSS